MSEHSRMAPSSMDRILLCPGSAVDNPPNRGSAEADAGTCAHSLGEKVLGGEVVEDSEYKDDETRSAVFKYVSYVRAHKNEYTNTEMHLEVRIESTEEEDHGGTMDTLLVSPDHLHVIDYKNGICPVNPYDNKQLLSYLSLANEKFPGRKTFLASIVQPNVFGKTECVEYSLDDIETHAMDVMLAAGDDSRTAGDHCKWCPLKQGCKENEVQLHQIAQDLFPAEGESEHPEWDGDECKKILGAAAVFAEMAKEASAQIRKLMMAKTPVEGWRLAVQLANRTWIDEDIAADIMIDEGVPTCAAFVSKLRSPAQLEKFSKAYKPLVARLTERLEKGVIAVTTDSKLPEYNPTDVFTEVK